MNSPNIVYTLNNIERVFELLVSSDQKMQVAFYKYLEEEYNNTSVRLYYVDIAEIARQLVVDFKNGETAYFKLFFEQVEVILQSCDNDVETLLVVGLFQDIQNVAGSEVNYHTGFNDWLNPVSKLNWERVIDFWEGIDGRSKNK